MFMQPTMNLFIAFSKIDNIFVNFHEAKLRQKNSNSQLQLCC